MPALDVEIISIHEFSDEEHDCGSPFSSLGSGDQDRSTQTEAGEDSEDEPRAAIRNPRISSGTQEELEYISGSESEFEELWVNEPPVPTFQSREAFRKVLETMEDPEDIARLYPKSLHPNFSYDETLADERQTLLDFVPSCTPSVASDGDGEPSFEQLDLSEFSVYRGISHGKGFNGQFEYPHIVSSEQKSGTFYLDGVISHFTECRRIIGAVIDEINIGGLDNIGAHTTAGQIWVRTKHSRLRGDCWYRLSVPATEYADYFHEFLWLADLNKHLIDYLCDACDRGEKIRLQHFGSAFFETLCNWHGHDESFKAWSQRSGCTDFRMHITMHASFLRDQAWSVSEQADFHRELRGHPVWDEVAAGIYTEDQQTNSKQERTVVTPNVGFMFTQAFPQWRPRRYNLLQPVAMHPKAMAYKEARQQNLRLPDKLFPLQTSATNMPDVSFLLEQAAKRNQTTTLSAEQLVGKVVVVQLSQIQQQYRFALVKEAANSGRTVRVVWLILPDATICGGHCEKTFYPVNNELFFSDECNCAQIPLRKIMATHEACVLSEERYSAVKIVIQLLYREHDHAFVTPTWSELLCSCQVERRKAVTSVISQQQSVETLPKIRNMSLFSGCGLLDYGLEESGTFETVFAIDHNESSIRSHAANSTSEQCLHVIGSVNSHLERLLRDEATLPDIDCITAGCPCQGFSRLNIHRLRINGQRNCSLLASTLSWVELLLPKFVLIENVPAMDHTPSSSNMANACAQAICCLVGMGYQVRKMVLNAYEHGSPTARERLFVIAAAPSMKLPNAPLASHGDDPDLKPVMTVNDVLQELAPLHNDTVINIQDPTHIPVQRLKSMFEDKVSLRNILKRIPKDTDHGLIKARQDGLLSGNQRIWVSELSEEQQGPSSRCLKRINAKLPFRTIVTTISPLDCRFGGMIVHPNEDRLLSLKEIRRAQGIPDWFLLVGSLTQQIEQIGNGVAWQVAITLGRSFGVAWRESCDRAAAEDYEKPGRAGTIVQLPNKLVTNPEEIVGSSNGKERFQHGLTKKSPPKMARPNHCLPADDFIKFLVTNPVSSLPEPRSNQSPEHTVSVRPKSEDVSSSKVQKKSPSSALVSKPDRQSLSEDKHETTDHESLLVGADGVVKHQRDGHGRMRSHATSTRKKQTIVVQIPARKRTASLTPPTASVTPRTKRNAGKHDGSDSDSDIIFIETRAVSKRPRML